MGKPIVGRWFVGRAQMRDGIGNVGAVPERDCGDDEVEAGGAKLLRLAATIGNPALLEGADDHRRGVTLLALVEASMRLTEAGAIKVFSDIRSGKTMERPGLEALLAYAREGDTLSVVRLDRLGRSLGELLTTVAMLKERGIALLSLEERIDTNSAAGELVFHVFGVIAHFERRLIAERTRDGIAAARARGKRPGRHPLDPEKIAAALELVKAGLSPTVAARQLGLGRSTVYREVGRAGIAR